MNEGNSGDVKANAAERDDRSGMINKILLSIGLKIINNSIKLEGENLQDLQSIDFDELFKIFNKYKHETLQSIANDLGNTTNNLRDADSALIDAINKLLAVSKDEYKVALEKLLKNLYELQIRLIIFRCDKIAKEHEGNTTSAKNINNLFHNITNALNTKLEALNKLFDAKMTQYAYDNDSGEQKREAQELPISQQEVLPEQLQEGGAAKYYKDKYKYMKYKMKYMELKNKL